MNKYDDPPAWWWTQPNYGKSGPHFPTREAAIADAVREHFTIGDVAVAILPETIPRIWDELAKRGWRVQDDPG